MFYRHVKGVLTSEECQQLIADGHARGFKAALVNLRNGEQELLTHIRNNERVTYYHPQRAAELQEKLMASVPDFPVTFKDVHFVETGDFFRLYKYVPGQYFKPHRDGSVELAGLESEITVLFYLNDTDGGETILMPHGKQMVESYIRIAPKQGDVLMFEHNVLHSGEPVNSGEKYVLRTDLFYKRMV